MRTIEVTKVHTMREQIGKGLDSLATMYQHSNAVPDRLAALEETKGLYVDTWESLQVDEPTGLFLDLEHADCTFTAIALGIQSASRTLYTGERAGAPMLQMYRAANLKLLQELRGFILVLMAQYDYNRIK